MADVRPLKLVPIGGGLVEMRECADGDGEYWVVAPYCTALGTANTLMLTLQHGLGKPSAYRAGQQFRFRAGLSNTGAATINVAGLGAKAAVTVTGAALPAGYIRTDVDTTITFDAVADRFVVGRETEYGSNSSGSFMRLANGTIEVWSNAAVSHACDQASGVFYRSPSADIWPLPAEVITDQPHAISASPASAVRWAGVQLASSSTASIRSYQATSGATVLSVNAKVIGRWY